MTFFERIRLNWLRKKTSVCVGLDPDLAKLPVCIRSEKHPIFAFNRNIVDATREYACCYKPQAAYYAGQNADAELRETIEYIHAVAPDTPVILDVKRGDIGSTAKMYAREVFERYNADAVTVNPYMGGDTLEPFTEHADRGVIVLCRTSNPGSGELQSLKTQSGRFLYEEVAIAARDRWNGSGNLALVIGATYPEELARIRELVPDMPFLVPGIGAQGGDVAKTVRAGWIPGVGGLMVNSSRGIIYASKEEDFAVAAGAAAKALRDQINAFAAI